MSVYCCFRSAQRSVARTHTSKNNYWSYAGFFSFRGTLPSLSNQYIVVTVRWQEDLLVPKEKHSHRCSHTCIFASAEESLHPWVLQVRTACMSCGQMRAPTGGLSVRTPVVSPSATTRRLHHVTEVCYDVPIIQVSLFATAGCQHAAGGECNIHRLSAAL